AITSRPTDGISALCAIHLGNSPRSTLDLTHNRRVLTTKERLRAAARERLLALCARRRERLLYLTPFCPAGSTNPTSINDEGVVTGSCVSRTPQFLLGVLVGWVRFP